MPESPDTPDLFSAASSGGGVASSDRSISRLPKGFIAPLFPTGKTISLLVRLPDHEPYMLNVGGIGKGGGDIQDGRDAFLLLKHVRILLRILNGDRWDGTERETSYSALLRGVWGSGTAKFMRTSISELGRIICERIPLDASGSPVASKATYENLLQFSVNTLFRDHAADDVAFRLGEANIKTRSLASVIISPSFYLACAHPEGFWPINHDEAEDCVSDLELALYLHLPGKVFRGATAKNPFRRNLRSLLVDDLGYAANSTDADLASRLRRDRGPAGSVLARLDGRRTFDGRLRVSLERASSVGYNLCAWIEAISEDTYPKMSGEMEKAWLDANLDIKDFVSAQNPGWRKVEDHEIELLEGIGYDAAGSLRFLQKVRSVLGYVRFNTAIAAAKGMIKEGTATGSAGKVVGGCLMAAYGDLIREMVRVRASGSAKKPR